MDLLLYKLLFIIKIGPDNEETTNEQEEKSGKKGKHPRKKNVGVEEAVFGKRQRLHAKESLLTRNVIWNNNNIA